jgi:site-specific DNA-methyltransferase (cytosine-N4-specific)
MPESVTDRCTKAHEYIFLLSKNPRYYFDHEAIKEPVSGTAHARKPYKSPDGWDTSKGAGGHGAFHRGGREKGRPAGVNPKAVVPDGRTKQNTSFSEAVSGLVDERNKRSVWTVPSKPYAGAHFATFPPDLIVPCVMAGCPAGGVVLDPFSGSGTTGQVALQQGRKYIGIELNPEYQELAVERITPYAKQERLFA